MQTLKGFFTETKVQRRIVSFKAMVRKWTHMDRFFNKELGSLKQIDNARITLLKSLGIKRNMSYEEGLTHLNKLEKRWWSGKYKRNVADFIETVDHVLEKYGTVDSMDRERLLKLDEVLADDIQFLDETAKQSLIVLLVWGSVEIAAPIAAIPVVGYWGFAFAPSMTRLLAMYTLFAPKRTRWAMKRNVNDHNRI